MSTDLPPLSAVRAFEAAARHLSFTRAAAELGMTQAAVSYQIKLLEERVGASLFLRLPRRIALSEAGKRLAQPTSEAFDLLRGAFSAAREASAGVLSITAVTTFATNWLVPRLGAFQFAHPRLAVRLDTSHRLIDFSREEFDLAIRTGDGSWPGLATHALLRARFTPMLSPDLLGRSGGLASPADLLQLPIIGASDPWWSLWFAAAGVPDARLDCQPDLQLGSQQLEGSAAIAGQGVAILTPAFFAADLAAGRLVQPFDLVQDDGCHYWLVYPEARRNVPKIRLFRDWLLAEVAAAGLAAA